MSYGWLITRDMLAEGDPDLFDSEAGVMGPRGLSDDIKARLEAGDGRAFRMYDDDGIEYYRGRLIGGDGLEPLEDFGAPNAGAVTIRYVVDGKWEVL